MPRLRAVVFDLDDTLYPEEDYVLSGFRAVADWAEAHVGVPATHGYFELERLFRLGVRRATFDRWLADHGLAGDGIVGELVRVYREHEPRIAPFPEAFQLLDRLRERYVLGLLSDGYLAVQQRKLDALRMRGWFQAILVTDELGRDAWKPSPRGFEVLLDRLGGVRADQAVYVSDNPAKDFLGARRAGMRSIRVKRPGGIYSGLEPSTPDHEPDEHVPGLDELERALARLEAVPG